MLISLLLAQLLLPASPQGPIYSQSSVVTATSATSGGGSGGGGTGLLAGLERYYAFDGDGTDSANGQTATALGTQTNYATGKLGQSAGVNSDNASGFHAPALNLMGDLTIAFWVHTMSGGGIGYCPAVGQMSGGGGTFINYAVFQVSHLTIYETGNNGSSTAILAGGKWEHVAFIRDATANTWTVYVDGVYKTQGGSVGPYSVPGAYLQIMHRDDLYSSFGTWRMDELGIWSRKLSLSEVGQLVNGGAGLAFSAF